MISCSARSIGPAASLALSGAARLRVHSVFRSALNLEAEGSGRLVSLRGPAGGGLPHEVVLERAEDFGRWRAATGACAWLGEGAIRLAAGRTAVVVELRHAERIPRRALPAIARPRAAGACAAALAELQEALGCELRIASLRREGRVITAMGARLRDAALAVGAAFQGPAAPLREAVAALVGLGPGLTPSGDDFLCGLLAAARASAPGLLPVLEVAAVASLGRTGSISAFLLRCAIEGFWPTPLVDLAEALAADREPEALGALRALCRLGHGSGPDLATGFLFGLERLGLGGR